MDLEAMTLLLKLFELSFAVFFYEISIPAADFDSFDSEFFFFQ